MFLIVLTIILFFTFLSVFYLILCLPEKSKEFKLCNKLFKKGSKTFYFASYLFPTLIREKIVILYAFCRITDDLTDDYSDNLENVKLINLYVELLESFGNSSIWIDKLESIEQIKNKDEISIVFSMFKKLVEKEKIPISYIKLLIKGYIHDSKSETIHNNEELIKYCRYVASSVGLLCFHLFNVKYDKNIIEGAADLGIAFQLTNISRDILTDIDNNRVYIPLDRIKEDLKDNPKYYAQDLILSAEVYYENAFKNIKNLPNKVQYAIMAALFIYRQIGIQIIEKPKYSKREYTTLLTKLSILIKTYFILKFGLFKPEININKLEKISKSNIFNELEML
jgi:phytoene synthase